VEEVEMLEIMRDTGEGSRRAPLMLMTGLVLSVASCAPDATAEEPTTAQSPVFFRDPSTSGPRLDVYDFDGHPVISVSGPIGSEKIRDSLSGDESLVETYRALHPDRSAPPAELIDLDRRFAPELAAIRAATPPDDGRSAVFEKTQAGFLGQACQEFRISSFTVFRPQECPWTRDLGLGIVRVGHNPNRINAGDRVYGWNNTNRTAIIPINSLDGSLPLHPGLAAHTWGFFTAPSTGGPFRAAILSNSATLNQGDAGVTWHRRFTIVH
jgi:hypothetical protein